MLTNLILHKYTQTSFGITPFSIYINKILDQTLKPVFHSHTLHSENLPYHSRTLTYSKLRHSLYSVIDDVLKYVTDYEFSFYQDVLHSVI